MHFATRLAAIAAFTLLLPACASKPFHYGYKPSVTPAVAMADSEACYNKHKLSSVAEVKAAQILLRSANKKKGALAPENECMRLKGYQIRQMTSEDKKRFMALDVQSRKQAAGRLMTTGKL